MQLLKLPDGAVKVLVEGGDRVKLRMSSLSDDKGYLFVEADAAKQIGDRGADTTALGRATAYISLSNT